MNVDLNQIAPIGRLGDFGILITLWVSCIHLFCRSPRILLHLVSPIFDITYIY